MKYSYIEKYNFQTYNNGKIKIGSGRPSTISEWRFIKYMSEVLDNIKSRRSVRKYKPDMVPQEIIDKIIEAGLYAPNGMSYQNTIIIEVTDKKLRDEISEMNRKLWEDLRVQIHFMELQPCL